jgi:hypothetical protein
MGGREFVSEMENVLSSLGDRLKEPDRASVLNFMEVGEYELAVDTLCEQLYEYEVELLSKERESILQLVRWLGLSEEQYGHVLSRAGPG